MEHILHNIEPYFHSWPAYIASFVFASFGMVRLIWKFTSGNYKVKENLEGKVVLVTGATAGIGLETAKELSMHGATVYLLCRNLKKAREVADQIKCISGKDVFVVELDTSSLASVRKCATEILEKVPKIDVLINNAGRLGIQSQTPVLTSEGLELTAATNYFGHFLLTSLLLDKIRQSAPSRIISVSSLMHSFVDQNYSADNLNFEKYPYNETQGYAYSKLSQILHGRYLAAKLVGTGVIVNTLHPGIVRTSIIDTLKGGFAKIMTQFLFLLFKNAKEGAQTSIYLATANEVRGVSGGYFADCKPYQGTLTSMDMRLAEEIFKRSCDLTGAKMI